MSELFVTVLNNAWIVSAMILVVVILRLCFRRIPKYMILLLWGIIGLKMLVPFDIHSSFGLLPNEQTINYAADENAPVIVTTGLQTVDENVNQYLEQTYAKKADTKASPTDETTHTNSAIPTSPMSLMDILAIAWMVGIIALWLYIAISYAVMRRKVKQSIVVESGVRTCDEIDSPFLFGFIKPQIYLPSGIEKEQYAYILEHERMHMKHMDQITKPVAFCLLSIYWFNPLCWLAYSLYCKDVELACDEAVIQQYGADWRSDYCQALLDCSTKNRRMIFSPLAFGEVGVKERIKKIMQYQKTKIGLVVLFAVVCVVAILCVGTRHKADDWTGNVIQSSYDGTVVSIGYKEIAGNQEPVLTVNVDGKNEDFVLTDEFRTGYVKQSSIGLPVHVTCEKTYDMDSGEWSEYKPIVELKIDYDAEKIMGQKPKVDPYGPAGVDGTILYYASENVIIFGGNYGLFVYNTKQHEYMQSVDLEPIGCNMTQGDDACDIQVNQDGTKVYLHKMSDSENMYVYSVADNTFVQEKYNLDNVSLYTGKKTPWDEYTNYDQAAVANAEGMYCVLINSYDGCLASLGYKYVTTEDDYELVYPLFPEKEYARADYLKHSDLTDILKVEMIYGTDRYVCEDLDAFKYIEKYSTAQKELAQSGCPFDTVVYVTMKDGTVGLILPAMDNCSVCIMADGVYRIEDEDRMSIDQMLKNGKFN